MEGTPENSISGGDFLIFGGIHHFFRDMNRG